LPAKKHLNARKSARKTVITELV